MTNHEQDDELDLVGCGFAGNKLPGRRLPISGTSGCQVFELGNLNAV